MNRRAKNNRITYRSIEAYLIGFRGEEVGIRPAVSVTSGRFMWHDLSSYVPARQE